MITLKQLFVAGKITRTHGVMGEWVCIGNTDALDLCPYVVLNMDGLYVPFFITSRRYQNETTWLFQVEGINSEIKAKTLVGKDVFLPLSMQEEAEQVSYEYFVGYKAYNEDFLVGTITAVNNQTQNVLFCIDTPKGVVMIPAVEDFIVHIDQKNKTITFNLPDGLLTIND